MYNYQNQNGVQSTLSQTSIGVTVRIHFDGGPTDGHTGTFLGIQNNNAVVKNGFGVAYIPLRSITSVEYP